MEPTEGTVSEIWRYPVKSMGGHRHASVSVTAMGVAGDRGWAIRDETAGGIRGAKKIPELMKMSARLVEEPTDGAIGPVEITMSDGSTIHSSDPDLHDRLTEELGRPVTLWSRQPATDTDHYLRGTPDHEDVFEELKSIFGREGDEPLPDLSRIDPTLLTEVMVYESPLGTYFDLYPLLLITQQSLNHLADLAPDSTVDVRRFRPNFVLDGADGDAGFPEVEWEGATLEIGSAVVELTIACPRCVMVTRPVDELPGDRPLLRTIVAEADQNLGVYANVIQPGEVHEGDAWRLTSEASS